MTTNQIQTNWPLQKPQQLVYVELGPDNGGMVLGICEHGLSFRSVAPVKTEGPVYFTFALDGKTRLNGAGEIAWLEDGGKSGGLKFTNISQQFREALHSWLASEATPKAIGREVTPATSLPLDSLSTPKPSDRSKNLTSVEEPKHAATAAPSVPSETKPSVPKPIIPAPEEARAISPAPLDPKAHETKIVQQEPIEPKPIEAKPVQSAPPKQAVHEAEVQIPAPAPTQKIKTKPVETKLEHAKPETAKPLPSKPAEVPRVKPVIPEPDLRTAAPLPAAKAHEEPTFSLPGFRLPSATIEDSPLSEKIAEAPRQQHAPPQHAAPEPVFVEPLIPQAYVPPPSVEQGLIEETEQRRLIPPPAAPMSWELREARQAMEEGILPESESPRLNRAAAGGILSLALVVLLGAFVLSFRREVGETLIRLGETLSGEDRKQVVPQQPAADANPASAPSSGPPSLSTPAATSPTISSANAPKQNSSPANAQTQKSVDQPNSQAANTGNTSTSALPAPQQAVKANPSAANSSTANSASANSNSPNPVLPNSTAGNSASTNAASSDVVREIQDLPQPKDAGSGQKEFEKARDILKGSHRQRDIPAAVDLLWTGVGKGYVPAEVTLADLYARGDGVKRSCTQARVLLRAAIQKGSPEARKRLDLLKRQGCS